MLEPKNTLVGLAGQKAWHIWAGDALPRINGKYRPSQLRTQKAGPEPATARGCGAACWLRPKGSAKTFDCGAWCDWGFGAPPNRKTKKPSAGGEGGAGASMPATAAAVATSAKRRGLR